MTDVTNTNSVLSQYSFDTSETSTTSSSTEDLGKTEFLELMIAQLNNQNPLKPSEDAAFIAELAQFSTVEGIQNMATGLDDLSTSYKSSQALQASALVGSTVTVDGNNTSTFYVGEIVYGTAEISTGAENLYIQIVDSSGEAIEDVALGSQSIGELSFKWDGANLLVNGELMDIDYSKFELDEDGNVIPHPAGEYEFNVVGNVGGTQTAMDVSTSKYVDSVTINDDNTIQLNLDDGTTAAMSEVTQINDVS